MSAIRQRRYLIPAPIPRNENKKWGKNPPSLTWFQSVALEPSHYDACSHDHRYHHQHHRELGSYHSPSSLQVGLDEIDVGLDFSRRRPPVYHFYKINSHVDLYFLHQLSVIGRDVFLDEFIVVQVGLPRKVSG